MTSALGEEASNMPFFEKCGPKLFLRRRQVNTEINCLHEKALKMIYKDSKIPSVFTGHGFYFLQIYTFYC